MTLPITRLPAYPPKRWSFRKRCWVALAIFTGLALLGKIAGWLEFQERDWLIAEWQKFLFWFHVHEEAVFSCTVFLSGLLIAGLVWSSWRIVCFLARGREE